jgi:hypothetical protein
MLVESNNGEAYVLCRHTRYGDFRYIGQLGAVLANRNARQPPLGIHFEVNL